MYSAGRSKADLLSAAVGRAVAGDDQAVMVHERPAVGLIAAEPDPVRQVRMMADVICDIQERSAPMQVAYREATAVDPSVAASVEDALRRRHETLGAVVNLLPADRLPHSPWETRPARSKRCCWRRSHRSPPPSPTCAGPARPR